MLNKAIITINDIVYVGQAGVEVLSGEANISMFQFVNMTSVKDDNTNTIAPDLKPTEQPSEPTTPTPTDPVEPVEPVDPVEPEKDSKLGLIIGISCGAVLVIALVVVLVIKKKKSKEA